MSTLTEMRSEPPKDQVHAALVMQAFVNDTLELSPRDFATYRDYSKVLRELEEERVIARYLLKRFMEKDYNPHKLFSATCHANDGRLFFMHDPEKGYAMDYVPGQSMLGYRVAVIKVLEWYLS